MAERAERPVLAAVPGWLAGPWTVLVFAALVAAYFHDRFWWPPDDGYYAYIASRILAGDTLNGTIQDLHAGYIALWHALMMWLFGEDIVSLRYPLAIASVAAAAIAYFLVRPHGRLPALAAGIAMTGLFFLPFINPSANWYAAFLTLVLAATLGWWREPSRGKWLVVGVLLATLFLTRQLNGVLAAMAVIAFVAATIDSAGQRWIARGFTMLVAIGAAFYVLSNGSLTGLALIGVWPLVYLGHILLFTRAGNREMLSVIGMIAIGGIAGLAPMVIFHLLQGTISGWLDDTIIAAFRLTQQPFVADADYIDLLAGALVLLPSSGATGFLNCLHWLLLLLAPAALGLWAVLSIPGRSSPGRMRRHEAIVITALVTSIGALHYEITHYLLYTSGLTLAALIWLAGNTVGLARWVIPGAAAAIGLIAIVWQAGQPLSRSTADTLTGQMTRLAPSDLPRAALKIEPVDVQLYRKLIPLVQKLARPGETILAVPMSPEIYFLADRRAPVRFASTAVGLQTETNVDRAIGEVLKAPPAVLIHRPEDKYNTPLSDRFLAAIRAKFSLHATIGEFRIYVRKDR